MATKKVTPFVDDYLAALLAQASHLISAEFHEIVLANGFSVTEWRVLASLLGEDGLSVGRLSEVSVTKQPTVTRLLVHLEQRGIVERFGLETDRRITLVRITDEGEKIIAHLTLQAKEHERRVLQPYRSRQASNLKIFLRQIIQEHRRSA